MCVCVACCDSEFICVVLPYSYAVCYNRYIMIGNQAGGVASALGEVPFRSLCCLFC